MYSAAVVGISFCLAWLIARKTVVEKYGGGILRIRTYTNKRDRIGSLTILIAASALFANYHIGFFEFKVSGELPPIMVIIIFLVLLALFWNSFNYTQLEVDKWRQTIIYSRGIFFTYSKQEIPFPEVTKILLVSSYSHEWNYTLYVETGSDRKEIFDSETKAETEKVADILKRFLELPVVYLKE